MKPKFIVMFIIGIIMITLTLYLYPSLPDKIPTHWGMSGEADNYQDKVHIYTPIALYCVSFGLIPLCRLFDPRKKNYARSQQAMDTIQLIFSSLFFVIWGYTLYECFHPGQIDSRFLFYPMLGITFSLFGNVMPKIKANYFIGIRSPWTLASEEVWYKTHRFCGKLWFFTGWIFMLGGIFITEDLTVMYTIIFMFILAGIPFIYSFICFKKWMTLPQDGNEVDQKGRYKHD